MVSWKGQDMGKSRISPNTQGKEWWGRRPLTGVVAGTGHTSWWKRYLHKIERQQVKRVLRTR